MNRLMVRDCTLHAHATRLIPSRLLVGLAAGFFCARTPVALFPPIDGGPFFFFFCRRCVSCLFCLCLPCACLAVNKRLFPLVMNVFVMVLYHHFQMTKTKFSREPKDPLPIQRSMSGLIASTLNAIDDYAGWVRTSARGPICARSPPPAVSAHPRAGSPIGPPVRREHVI
jgi:hypothetical protein